MQESLFVILPYESSTQSAVLFDSFRNGTAVITTDCGSLMNLYSKRNRLCF